MRNITARRDTRREDERTKHHAASQRKATFRKLQAAQESRDRDMRSLNGGSMPFPLRVQL
jgi:hypothetical protein